ncbi:MAG TPA: LuxR C-terminal-related transcriptional regulator [Trebonia sp.]|jgi:LuxR family maltose regulon positive regulatory protein|nr:LuxR C-terminal-related transcriptional regulator [Trebonia sp.]
MKPDTRYQAAENTNSSGPAVWGAIVFRRDLFKRLAAPTRVTQISAPGGSGKTVLLESWVRETGMADSVAWLRVPAGEHDPQRFWISLLDALRATTAGSKLVRPLTGAPNPDGWAVVERLLADLSELEDPLWLVIDDVHELRSAEALTQLELLLLRAPGMLRFVLTTRGHLRLGLHRLRLAGELTEIRFADLQFTPGDARELLRAVGIELSDRAVEMLVRRTEGWAAGLRLAALSLAGRPDPERFATEFSGNERTVAEYLLAEVLDRQPEPVRRLLLRTSICDRISGELADLLTGGTGGERTLQDLEEAGAFVLSLDLRRSWFRYHQLFADLLRMELRRTEPEAVGALHTAAADWYAAHGYLVEAVRHAQAAQDWQRAVRLLSDEFVGFFLDGQAATVHDLLASFPADIVAGDAELSALAAADQVLRGSPDTAERHLARATEMSASAPEERRGRLQAVLAMLRLISAQEHGNLAAVAREAERLLGPAQAAEEQIELGDDLRTLALVNLGIAELWALRPGEAERHLEQGGELARQTGRPFLEFSAMAHRVWAASFRSFGSAAEQYARAVELAHEHGWSENSFAAVAYTGLGAIRVWQMRLTEAASLLEHAERVLRPESEPAAGVVLNQARGMLALARGRDADALTAFRAAERLAGLLITAHPRSAPMRAQTVQTLVRLGQKEQAWQVLARLDRSERGEMRVALATLRLAENNPRAAVSALARVLDGSAPVTNLGWLTKAFLLEAIARDTLGERAAAGRALERALDLAEPDGAVFAFVMHPAPGLLEWHAGHGTAHAALISQILDLLARKKEKTAPGEPLRLLEPLTESESRVLGYLPTSLPAPEIAAELTLSVNTVRTHMRHLYAKLGAHRRTEAVKRARALGLLAPYSR